MPPRPLPRSRSAPASSTTSAPIADVPPLLPFAALATEGDSRLYEAVCAAVSEGCSVGRRAGRKFFAAGAFRVWPWCVGVV